ncbi:DNA repair protein RecN [Nonlabens xiamenensis]|uniref:DNA repair protein RecN n=1 Tax=Nonlabens xiamenensis TaxID=2341043 RepID=UPI000F6072BC|nr:DNA repair protein RecN [Nonlabens xiamenensis]
MLKQIHIENFALIDQLDLDLQGDLTIITGETGAGKSILLGALGLVLGQRADLTAVRDTSRKCVIEAQFDIQALGLQDLFEVEDLDYESVTFVRREILPSGKSRAFVNDTPVNLAQLTALGKRLIDIHSQHQTMSLAKGDFQMEVLDAYVMEQTKKSQQPSAQLLSLYKASLIEFRQHQHEYNQLVDQQAQFSRDLDYNSYLLEELESAKLDELDQDALEQERDQLGNIETITATLQEVSAGLGMDEQGSLDQMRLLSQRMGSIVSYSSDFAELRDRLSSVLLELEDIHQEIGQQENRLEPDPGRLETVDAQLTILENLLRKHQTSDVNELKQLRDQLADKVFETHGLEEKIKTIQRELEQDKIKLKDLSYQLRQLREGQIPNIESEILETVRQLGMPDAQFKVVMNETDQYTDSGLDQVEFLFTANKGTTLLSLDKAASGGELSRLMLAIKAMLSRCKQLPTIIFDEIDTGVSGAIADKMAHIMKQMSQDMQVIAITHLPQIAAAGKDHLMVRKRNLDSKTISELIRLDEATRLEEIAQMLSGGIVSDAARENARALLN